MKRKNLLIIFSILLLSLLVGCERNSPKNVVKAFSNSMKTFDFEKMDTYIYSEDKSKKLPDFEETDELERAFIDYFKKNASKIEFKIIDSTEENNKASVKVKYKYVDGGRVIRNTVMEGMQQAVQVAFTDPEISSEKMEEMLKTIVDKNMADGVEDIIVEKDIIVPCIKIENKWYLDGINEDLLNVILSNFIYVSKDLDKVVDFQFK